MWVIMAGSIALTLVILWSCVWYLSWPVKDYTLILSCGVITVYSFGYGEFEDELSHVSVDRQNREFSVAIRDAFTTTFEHDTSGRIHRFSFALWMPLAGLLLSLAPLNQRRMHDPRAGEGTCMSCGYDLRGIVGGVCPECGLAVLNDFANK